MTLTITETMIISDHSVHTARHSPGRNGWEVSWLPGQILDRNTAITAMTLADTTAERDLHDRHRLRPHIQSLAAELGLTAPQALAMAARPPATIHTERGAAEPSEPEPGGA